MNVGRKLASAVGVAAFVPLTAVGFGQQAQAAGCAPAQAATSAPQPGSRLRVRASWEIRVAPAPECQAITLGSPADLMIYFCSATTATGRWTYLRDHHRGVNGWVPGDALRDGGSRVACPTSTPPPPPAATASAPPVGTTSAQPAGAVATQPAGAVAAPPAGTASGSNGPAWTPTAGSVPAQTGTSGASVPPAPAGSSFLGAVFND
ncbi:hypothetical protein [Cryptosporangium sp. NPDC051539]|uniref:hypothetical protein n=1 Tax=Cryptosporangium sp. NPDC051539 TaxID=3363962 RepID=UPI00379217BA